MNNDLEFYNNETLYYIIARELIENGVCFIGWTDKEFDHRDFLFVLKDSKHYGYIQRGLSDVKFFVNIIGHNSYGFNINQKDYEYYKEKLYLKDNPCDNKICELIDNVILMLIAGGIHD